MNLSSRITVGMVVIAAVCTVTGKDREFDSRLIAQYLNVETLRMDLVNDADSELRQTVPERFASTSQGSLLRARIYRSMLAKQYSQVVVDFERLSKAEKMRVVDHFHLGVAYSETGNRMKALSSWRSAGASRYFLRLGQEASILQHWEQAAKYLNVALGLDPEGSKALLQKGYVLQFGFQDCESAITYYRRSIEYDPENTSSYQRLGQCLGQLQEWQQAVDAYQAGLARCPSCVSYYLDLAEVANWSGDRILAIEALNQALQLNPKLVRAHITLARLWIQLAETDRAGAAYEAAIHLDPANVALRLEYGEFLIGQGDLQGALKSFEQVLETDPENLRALSHISGFEQHEP